MPQSFSCLHTHIVFSTKNREPLLTRDLTERLYRTSADWPGIANAPWCESVVSKITFTCSCSWPAISPCPNSWVRSNPFRPDGFTAKFPRWKRSHGNKVTRRSPSACPQSSRLRNTSELKPSITGKNRNKKSSMSFWESTESRPTNGTGGIDSHPPIERSLFPSRLTPSPRGAGRGAFAGGPPRCNNSRHRQRRCGPGSSSTGGSSSAGRSSGPACGSRRPRG